MGKGKEVAYKLYMLVEFFTLSSHDSLCVLLFLLHFRLFC